MFMEKLKVYFAHPVSKSLNKEEKFLLDYVLEEIESDIVERIDTTAIYNLLTSILTKYPESKNDFKAYLPNTSLENYFKTIEENKL